MKHKRRRHDGLSAVDFPLRSAKGKAKEEVGPEFSLIFRTMSQAPRGSSGDSIPIARSLLHGDQKLSPLQRQAAFGKLSTRKPLTISSLADTPTDIHSTPTLLRGASRHTAVFADDFTDGAKEMTSILFPGPVHSGAKAPRETPPLSIRNEPCDARPVLHHTPSTTERCNWSRIHGFPGTRNPSINPRQRFSMPTTSALNSPQTRYVDTALKVIRGEGTGRLIGAIVLLHLVLIFLRPQFFLAPLAWIKFPLLYSFLPLACLLSVWSSRSGKPLPRQLVVMVLFLVLGGVTGLFAVNRSVAFHRWRSLFQLLFTVVLPLALAITGGRQMKLLSKTLVFLGGALGAIGIVSRGTGPGDFLLDENDLCFTLNFLLPFPLLGIAAAKSFPKRLGLTAICGVILAGIVATQSRGGFVGLVCMVLFLLVRSHHRGALLALLLFLGSGAAIFAPKSYWDDMATISQVDQGTAKSRRQFWTVALDMWLDPKNTIWGVGMGNSSYRLLEYQPPELTRVLENRMWGRAVHSTYLQLLPDLGLLGALLVGSLVFKSFRDLSRHGREIRSTLRQLPKRTSPLIKNELTHLAGFLLAIQTSWIGVLSTGAFISALYYPPLWLLGAFTVIASHYWRRLKEPVEMGLKTSE